MWLYIITVVSLLLVLAIGSYLLYIHVKYKQLKDRYSSYLHNTKDYGQYMPILNMIFNNLRPMQIHPGEEFVTENEIDGGRMLKISPTSDFLSNLGIQDVFVVNLDRAPDKMENMISNLNNIGITNFTRMQAFDGKTEVHIMKQELPEFTINDEDGLKTHQEFIELINYDYVGLGQQGCTCSHLYTLKFIVQNKIPAALVLEDDVCFHPLFQKLFTTAWKNRDNDGLVFSLAFNDAESKICGNYKRPTWVQYSKQTCACYIVTYDGAKQILQRFSKKYFPILPCADDLPFLSLRNSYKLYYNNQNSFDGYPRHCGNRGCGIVTTPGSEGSTSSISNVNKSI